MGFIAGQLIQIYGETLSIPWLYAVAHSKKGGKVIQGYFRDVASEKVVQGGTWRQGRKAYEGNVVLSTKTRRDKGEYRGIWLGG